MPSTTSPPSTPRRRESILFTNGHALHVLQVGVGKPLLLLMGLGGNVDMWDPLLEHLTDRRIIAFDAPGTGLSSTPMLPVHIPALADIAAAVLDHVDVGSADVLGFSYGGAVAQQIAVQYPHRVRRLILAATNAGVGSQPADPAAAQALLSPVRYYWPELFSSSAEVVYGGAVGREPELQKMLASSRTAHPPTVYGYSLQLLGGAGWSSLPFLADIAQPTMVLCGDDDPLVPLANSHMLADKIPDARLTIMTGSGHLLLMDEAGRSAIEINAFLSQPDSAG